MKLLFLITRIVILRANIDDVGTAPAYTTSISSVNSTPDERKPLVIDNTSRATPAPITRSANSAVDAGRPLATVNQGITSTTFSRGRVRVEPMHQPEVGQGVGVTRPFSVHSCVAAFNKKSLSARRCFFVYCSCLGLHVLLRCHGRSRMFARAGT